MLKMRDSPGLVSPRSSSRGPGSKDVTPLSPVQKGQKMPFLTSFGWKRVSRLLTGQGVTWPELVSEGVGPMGEGGKCSKPDSKCLGRWRRETAMGPGSSGARSRLRALPGGAAVRHFPAQETNMPPTCPQGKGLFLE